MVNYLSVSNRVLKELSEERTDHEIYHYTSPTGFEGIIQNKHLWFTDRFCLNDKSEGYYVLDLFIDNIDKMLIDTPLNDKKDEIVAKCKNFKEGMQYSKMNIYQVSFSLEPDSLCMWNYYTKGDSIQGYNLHFNSEELCDSIEEKYKGGDSSYPYLFRGIVEYKVENQINKLHYFICEMYNAILNDKNNNADSAVQTFINRIDMIFERITLLGVLFKAPCFEVEKEYRIALDLYVENGEAIALKTIDENGNEIKKKFKTEYRNNLFVPHFEMDFDTKVLKGITLSPTIDFEKVKCNLEIFLYNYLGNVDISKSNIPVRF